MTEPRRWRAPAEGGEVEVLFEPSPAPAPHAPVLILAHGAGSHMDHETIRNLAGAMTRAGLGVARFNFAYRAEGRRAPDRMPRLTAWYGAAVDSVRQHVNPERLLVGGQSMGGRAASLMVADGLACDGLVLLAYPLHPAGKPERRRDAHLDQVRVPALCCNGTRDGLCRRDLMDDVVARLSAGQAARAGAAFTMHWLDGADHGYRVLQRSGRTRDHVFAEIGEVAAAWARTALA